MIPMTNSQKRKAKIAEKNAIASEIIFEWDQQPGEENKDFKLFRQYLAMGRSRNYAKVSRMCEISYSAVCKYAEKNSWKMRAEEYDFQQDEEFLIKLEEEVLRSRIRQQRIGSEMQNLAERGIEMLQENIEDLTAGDIAKLADVGVKIERLSLGSSTENVESHVNGKVEIKVEEIPSELAAKIGRELAISQSEEMEINI